MRKPKLIESYTYLHNDEVSLFAHAVVRKTTASKSISDGDKRTAVLLAALTAYDAAVESTDYASPSQTAMLDQLRTEVKTQLGRLAKSLNLDYTGLEVALLSSGLTMADPNSAARPAPGDDKLIKITLTDGKSPGCIAVNYDNTAGFVQRLTRYNTTPGLPPEHWPVLTGGGRTREVGPFPKGTNFEAMAAGLTGSTTDPVYGEIVSRLAQ